MTLPEIGNRIIAAGRELSLMGLPPPDIRQRLHDDPVVAALPDEQLEALIEEAGRYWRDHLDEAVERPENVLIFPVLMLDCAEARLAAISRFAAAAGTQDEASIKERKARWITVVANSMIAKGMALLLLPDPENAGETFVKAYWAARGLPDFGELRLREVLWATCGQQRAAQMAGQPQAALAAERHIAELTSIPGRVREAKRYLREVRAEMERIDDVLRQRSAAQPEPAPPPSAKTPDDDATSYALEYMERLAQYAASVLTGRLSLDEAKQKVLEETDLERLEPRQIYFISQLHQQVVASRPDQAAVLTELNYTTALAARGDHVALTRAQCAYALAVALAALATRRAGDTGPATPVSPDNVALLERAVGYFEEALAVFDRDQSSDSANYAAQVVLRLVTCHRALGNYAAAIAASHDAIRRLAGLPEQRDNLGVAYGNLASVQARTGDLSAAFDNHYRALQVFLEVKDIRRVRQALTYIAGLAAQIGRLDDAIAASEQAIELLTQVPDLEGVVEAYLSLAHTAFRARRYEQCLRVLSRAERLLAAEPRLEPQPEPRAQSRAASRSGPRGRERLALLYELEIWRGTFFTALLGEPSGEYTLEKASGVLEHARRIALELGDEDKAGHAALQLAVLYERAGDLDRAEALAGEVDPRRASEIQQARRHEVLGTIRLKQGEYDDALRHFHAASAGYGPGNQDRLILAYYNIGDAYERMGRLKDAVGWYEKALEAFEAGRSQLYEQSRLNVMGHAAEVYEKVISCYGAPGSEVHDPVRALYWLEKSKSRTFVEAMGLSYIPSPDGARDGAPDGASGVDADLVAEQQLLERLNTVRRRLFEEGPAAADRLAHQRELDTTLRQLNAIWDRLAQRYPEYVDLRRGDVAEWSEIKALLS